MTANALKKIHVVALKNFVHQYLVLGPGFETETSGL